MDDITPQYNPPPLKPMGEQPKQNKKLLLIIGIILSVILIVILFYFLVLRKPSTTTTEGPTFPVGGNVITNEQPIGSGTSDIGKTSTGGGTSTALQKLSEIYKGPIAGYEILQDGHTIRAFDRALGRLVEIDTLNGGSSLVSDQPILGIHDATFVGNNEVILRSLDDLGNIKSILYTITNNTNGTIPLAFDSGIALADNILELAANQDGSKVVLVIKDPLGANIDLLDTATKTLTRQGTLPLSEWIPTITSDGTIYLSAKASRFAESGTYKLEDKKLIMSIPAQTGQTTTIAPTGIIAYDSGSSGGQYTGELRDPNILSQADPQQISFVTIAEKCGWTDTVSALYCGVPNNVSSSFPDDWYLGTYSFSDTLHRFNFLKGEDEFIFNPSLYKANLDMVDIKPTETAVYIKNKSDEHLWMYRLTDQMLNTATATTSAATPNTP